MLADVPASHCAKAVMRPPGFFDCRGRRPRLPEGHRGLVPGDGGYPRKRRSPDDLYNGGSAAAALDSDQRPSCSSPDKAGMSAGRGDKGYPRSVPVVGGAVGAVVSGAAAVALLTVA